MFFEQQVVGWGLDEKGMTANKLKMVKMPVVSQDTCIKSQVDFFSRFTHEATFCAGFRNGIFYYYYYYYYYNLLQLSFHLVAVVLTLVQTKQIRKSIHKRNKTKTQYKQYKTQ